MTTAPDARLFDLATRSDAFGPLFEACDTAALSGDMQPVRDALGRALLCAEIPALVGEALRTLSQSDLWSPQHGGPGRLPLYRSGTLSVGLMRLDPAQAEPLVLSTSCNDMLVGCAGPATIEFTARAVDDQREALVGERWEKAVRPGEVISIPAETLATALSVSASTVVVLALRSRPTAVFRSFSPEGTVLERDVVHRDLARARYLLHVLAHVGQACDALAIRTAVGALAYPLEAELSTCLRSLAGRGGETACR